MNSSAESKLSVPYLEGIKGYRQLNFYYDNEEDAWILHFELNLPELNSSLVPQVSNWYARIDPVYPLGRLIISPAATGGIKYTFPHQKHNRPLSNKPWTSGDLCLKTPLGFWGRIDYSTEPRSAEKKLIWHLERTIEWVKSAATGQLTIVGDFFELPPLPGDAKMGIAFCETEETYRIWSSINETNGIVKLVKLPFVGSNRLAATSFNSGKKQIVQYKWGTLISEVKDEFIGSWIKLKSMPIQFAWDVPDNWVDMSRVLQEQGIQLTNLMHNWYRKSPSNIPKVLFLGFPIPEKFGADPVRMHWLSMKLPQIPDAIKGFRDGSDQLIKLGVKQTLQRSRIEWHESENWAKDQITLRGKLDMNISEKKILIIGAGSLGSLIGELLARLACASITIVDSEMSIVGNFSRHTLTMENLNQYKAEAICKRLNSIFPFIKCTAISKSLRDALKENENLISNHDLIIDITAEDEVLQELSERISEQQGFASISIGYKARRLFCYISHGEADHSKIFAEKVKKYIENDLQEINSETQPYDGIGCWHPLFPARFDSITMLASTCVKILEQEFSKPNGTSQLFVVEEIIDGSEFNGLKVIKD